MKQKLFVVLLFTVAFQSYILAQQDTPSIKLKCPKPICTKIVCTGGVKPTVKSNGCPGCPICLQKRKCEPPKCPAIKCPFGSSPQPTVLPNGCPGCRKCVKCVRPTILDSACAGKTKCGPLID